MRTKERMVMDIEQFYDEDPRRRSSEEIEFGRDWSDGSGVRSEVSWVADTGELYAMREPDAPINMDPVGDEFVESLSTESVTVEVLGTVNGREAVDQLLQGWEDEMVKPDSLSWVRQRVAQLTE
jgi:hypothetical protein